jgi:hypothetical protein
MDGPKTQAKLCTGHKAKTKQNKNTTQKTKKMRNTDPAKKNTNKRGRIQMLAKDKQFVS